MGLILVDTKYEFGKDKDGNITLIDEIHTPDSSRYFYMDGYSERQDADQPQKQLSKEFVRQWLISNGFQGKMVSKYQIWMSLSLILCLKDILNYMNTLQEITIKADATNVLNRVENNILDYLS